MTYRNMTLRMVSGLLCVLAFSGGLAGCDTSRAGAAGTASDSVTADDDHAEHDDHDAKAHGGDAHAAEQDGHDAEEGHAEHAADRVELSAEQRAQLDIEIGEARAGSAGASIQAPATLHFDADRVARIGPRLQAKVVEVSADLGDRVSRGDTLAVLDSVALGKEKAAYMTASARYRTRQAAYARDRKLAADQIVSESALAETRAAYQQAQAERRAERAELRLYGLDNAAIDAIERSGDEPLSRLELVAPRDGVIAKRDVVAGQTMDANETPIHVVDNSRMWLMIDAAEQALPRLVAGQSVTFTVRPLPDERFTGEIDWISPRLDAEARTVRVRAIVDNPRGLLRAGMFANATIQTDTPTQGQDQSSPQGTLVPVDAVQQIGERAGVFVPAEEANAFRFQPVETGAESAGQVEIRSGIAAGDALVVRGAFDLKAALTARGRSAAHSH